MIDLHSHIIPGIDDGAADLNMSLEMARIAVADGIRVMAATPHITPGVYNNSVQTIERGAAILREALKFHNLPLELTTGADVHVTPNMGAPLIEGQWPRLAGTRYFLFEPPHRVMPPHLVKLAKGLMQSGLIPVLTHPERLTWIEHHYDVICELSDLGVVVQLTASSVTGEFGQQPKYWSDRMLAEGRVDILATDAHNVTSRPPVLSRARDYVAHQYGGDAAVRMVGTNPLQILLNEPIEKTPVVYQPQLEYQPAPSVWQRVSKFAGLHAHA